jgi:oligopeptidase B
MAIQGLSAAAEPPVAKQVPYRMEKFGSVRTDDYYWLRDRNDPEVLAYLKEENDYAAAALKGIAPLQKKLFAEMKGRVKEDDSSAPFSYGGYYYYTMYRTGKEYPVYARKKGTLKAQEEILLDVNDLASAKPFCQVGFPAIRPDQKMMAYAVDTGGRGFYDIYFKDLVTGRLYSDKIKMTAGDMAWANDGRTLFYVRQDTETLRRDRVMSHELGRLKDVQVYYEPDDTFDVQVSRSRTGKYVFIRSGSTLSTEYRLIDADRPSEAPVVFQPRLPKLEYDVADGGDRFYVLNNDNALNFKVSVCPSSSTARTSWSDLVPQRDDTLLENMDVFDGWLVLKERSGALGRLHVYPRDGAQDSYISFDEPAYTADAGDNYEYKTDTLRVTYESLTTPESVYDVDLKTGRRSLVKRREVLGGFKPENYEEARLWFEARDGEMVPVSLVYKKGINLASGVNPVYVTSYGAYGDSSDPYFSSSRLSLLDRGFIYAVPHILGGSEMGRRWYEDGRLLKKKNTFYDFIDATRYLVDRGYTSPGHIYAEGGSAGGLLMGAVANMAPELYKGIIAEVPFVDVVTTMLDPDIPLTTGEYNEWGDPNVKEYYDYMLSYSPYDNVAPKAYPSMFVIAALNDSRVQYWEPAKWVAKLRAMKTDKNLLILKTDMDTGHGGKSGRFEALELASLEYAFILHLEGINR